MIKRLNNRQPFKRRFTKHALLTAIFLFGAIIKLGTGVANAASWTNINVIKTPNLNTAMPQGDIIIDNLTEKNFKIKINDTSHFRADTTSILTDDYGGTYYDNVYCQTGNAITYPNYVRFDDPFEITWTEAAHDMRGEPIDVTLHVGALIFTPYSSSPGFYLPDNTGNVRQAIFSMYQDTNGYISPLVMAPGDWRVDNLRNVETKYNITTTLKYSKSGKTVHGKYLTKYTDLDQPSAEPSYDNYNNWEPESVWLLDGYDGDAYVSTDTTLNETAWKEYNGRYFAATAVDNDNTLSATASAVITFADAEYSKFNWYGYGCSTNILVNETGKKLPPDVTTTKKVETSYGSGSHVFNVSEKNGTSASCEITSDFNYVKSDNIPSSWQITDDFPTDFMSAPSMSDVHVYTKPLADVISDDDTEIPGANDYRNGSTDITSKVTLARNSDGKMTISSSDYELVKAKRVYVEFTAPVKAWDSIPSSYKSGASTKEINNSTTTSVSTSDKTSTATATAPLSVHLDVSPHITVTKTAHIDDTNNNGKADYGEKVTYSFVVKNDGTSSLSNVRLSDSLLGFTDRKVVDSLTAGESKSYTAPDSVTVSVAQAKAGKIDNTVTAKGTPPAGISDVTATATATVPTAMPSQSISIEKHVDKTQIAANDAVPGTKLTYSFTVRNTGQATIRNAAIVDSMKALGTIKLNKTTLAPSETATATAIYQITSADINSGTVTNTAHATGTGIDDSAITSGDSTVTTKITAQKTGLILSKTVDKSQLTGDGAKAGAELSYGFKVTNDGNVTMTDVSISDKLSGVSTITMSWPGTAGVLEAGQSATGTAKYSVKQSDVDAGTVTNTAIASGTNKSTGNRIDSNTADATTAIDRTPRIDVAKAADPTHIGAESAVPGTTITYNISIKNSGNTTLSMKATDSMAEIGNVTLTKSTLAPNETATATVKHAITSDDINAGTVSNTVNATGTTPDGKLTTTGKATATTSIEKQAPKLTIEKTVDKKSLAASESKAGTKLTYSFKITNAGNVTISEIGITDKLSGLSDIKMSYPKVSGELAPGAIATGTATYAITLDDIANEHVSNTANATGKNKATGTGITSNESTVTTDIVRSPSMTLTKSSDPTSVTAMDAIAGHEITYNFVITNTGNTQINGLKIVDSMKEIGTITPSKDSIAPGETTTATAKHKLTQAEIDAGSVTNTAKSTGNINGTPVTSNEAKVTTPIVTPKPSIVLSKTVDKAKLTGDMAKAGADLSYGFKITNNGNVTISGITISDKLSGVSTITISWPGAAGALEAGQSATGTAKYNVKQSDVDTGSVTNTAQATGTSKTTGTNITSNESTATTDITRSPSMTLTKSSTPTNVNAIDAVVGHEITYNFKITNTGNTRINELKISDSMKEIGTVTPSKNSIAPGETATATAKHKLTQAEIDAGTVTNTATATGNINGTPVTSNESKVTTPIVTPKSGIKLTKTVDKQQLAGNEAAAGTQLTYTFKIENTGNIPVNDVSIDDKLHGISSISIDWNGHDRSIPAGTTVTGTATYKITQEDIDAGTIKNTATATGTDAHGNKLTSSSDVTTSIARSGKIEAVKTVDKKSIPISSAKPGDVITYSVEVRNTGNVTLRNVVCDDSMKEIGRIPLSKTQLNPNETATGTARHTLTQADIDAGTVENTATATANSPVQTATSVTSRRTAVTTLVAQNPQLTVTKTADTTHIPADAAKAGAKIGYTLKVSNTGNVTISGVNLDDELAAKSLKIDWGSNASHTLAPGQSVAATTSYEITDDDIDRGIVENVAQASGKAPNGSSVKSNAAKASTTIEKAEPAMTVTKTGTEQVNADEAEPGYEIEFDFEVENIGNTTLNGISIDDELDGISGVTLDETTLAAGEKTNGKATYKLTQADIDAGVVKNIAKANAKTPTDVDVTSNESEHDVTIDGISSLSFEKTVDQDTVSGADDKLRKTELTYSFVIRNTGTRTISDIRIADDLKGLGEIKFGEKTAKSNDTDSSTNSSDDDLSNADDDRSDAGNGKVSTQNADAINAADDSADSMASESDDSDNGNNDVDSDGDRTDGLTDSDGITLAPGESITATAKYMICDDDIKAGHVTNTAKVTGNSPDGNGIESNESEATTKITEVIPDAPAQNDDVASDLVQTGIDLIVPSSIAIAGIAFATSIRRRKSKK